jgi:hypothetical protein
VHISLFSFGNRDHRGDRTAHIEQGVEFDSRLGGAKARPRKQAQAQVNGRRIQRVDALTQLHTYRFLRI